MRDKPAFPRTGHYPDTSNVASEDLREAMDTITRPEPGMSLREYAAVHALAGLLANTAYRHDLNSLVADADKQREVTAFVAVKSADALLEAMAKPKGTVRKCQLCGKSMGDDEGDVHDACATDENMRADLTP